MTNKSRLIILGAGFSRPAGFPLATELWQEIRARTRNLVGRASKFNDDLEAYIRYRRDCDGLVLTADNVNFEDFMRFLDIEHFLRLRGSDTWSDEGNEGTVVTKTLIGQILADHIVKLTSIPDLYLKFAERLQPNDIVITFNYDTLLEESLDAVTKPYRLFPSRYKSVNNNSGIVDSDTEEVVVLKMHGSIDWFDRKGFEDCVKIHRRLGAPPAEDIIFSHAEELRLRPIVDGPSFDHDPLRTIYRVQNLAALYKKSIMFLATPRMLPPSSMKILYANLVSDYWSGIDRAGALNFGMAIVGFSLSQQDEYARQIVYRLVTNYQNINWRRSMFGLRKTPLVIVNHFQNEHDKRLFKNRYQFVEWKRATVFGEGFDLKAVDSIFQ